jgi:hypothetical protein
MPNLWDHLPNAKHIDAILASVKAHPKEWGAEWNAEWDAAWDRARGAAWDAAREAAREAARDAAWGEARDATWDAAYYAARVAAWDAIIALIAYDDCAYMLDSDLGELEILAKFGDERAILLLPACKAFAAIKEKTYVNS